MMQYNLQWFSKLYNILLMLSPQSSCQKHRQSPKILNFQIPLEDSKIIKVEQFANRKIKKLQLPDRMKRSKVVKMLQDIQFQNLIPDGTSPPKQHQQSVQKKATSHLSSYLAYKQQKVLKFKHNSKISFLQNKYIQKKQRQSVQKQYHSERQIQTQGNMRKDKKTHIIELKANVSTEFRESMNRREIYMKTSTGKRSKVDTIMYLGKIQAKFDINSVQQSKMTFCFTKSPQQLQCQSIFPIRSLSTPLNTPPHPENRLNFRRHSIKRQNRTLSVTPNDRSAFRPWSSDNSELQP